MKEIGDLQSDRLGCSEALNGHSAWSRSVTIEDDKRQKISILASYDTMVEFIERWFERGSRSSEGIGQMLGALTRHDEEGGYSFDGAAWNEYMDIAYRKLEEEGGIDPLRSINPRDSRGNS